MPLEIECSNGHSMRVARSRAGTVVRCPICREKTLAPPVVSEPQGEAKRRDIPTPPIQEDSPAKRITPSPSTPPPLSAPSNLGSQVRGFSHDRNKRWSAYYLSMALAVVALFSVTPAVIEVADHFNASNTLGVERWVYWVFLMGVVQLAFAFYLAQLPDWGSVWVVTWMTLLVTAIYAMLLGVFTLGSSSHALITMSQLTGAAASGVATRWLLIMLSVTGLLAYFSGRLSFRWHKAFLALCNASSNSGR